MIDHEDMIYQQGLKKTGCYLMGVSDYKAKQMIL